MKILLVSSKYMPEYAGSALRAHRTYLRLREKYGINFQVLASSVTNDLVRSYKLDGVGVTVIPGPAKATSKGLISKRLRSQWNHWRVAVPTWRYLVKHSFDVMHVFGKTALTSAAISYAKATQKPLMVELVNATNDPNQSESRFLSFVLGQGYPSSTKIVCLSKDLEAACLRKGYTHSQLWVRPNPIDESRFFYERERKDEYQRRTRLFEPKDKILCYIAKFIPRKKQDFAVRVLEQLPDEYKLVLAGPLEKTGPLATRDKEYYQSIISYIHDHSLETRVKVEPEFVKHPEEYMKASDVFLMPAVDEAFGTPFAEAIACGLPVIVNDLHGVYGEWINDGENGYLCKLDPALWAEKVVAATHLGGEQMRSASGSILKQASTKVIDSAYHNTLQTLYRIDPDRNAKRDV